MGSQAGQKRFAFAVTFAFLTEGEDELHLHEFVDMMVQYWHASGSQLETVRNRITQLQIRECEDHHACDTFGTGRVVIASDYMCCQVQFKQWHI